MERGMKEGVLEGRRCRRFRSPGTLRSRSHLDRDQAMGWGKTLWRRARRRVHWNSVPSERCNALSSLPDSAS